MSIGPCLSNPVILKNTCLFKANPFSMVYFTSILTSGSLKMSSFFKICIESLSMLMLIGLYIANPPRSSDFISTSLESVR